MAQSLVTAVAVSSGSCYSMACGGQSPAAFSLPCYKPVTQMLGFVVWWYFFQNQPGKGLKWHFVHVECTNQHKAFFNLVDKSKQSYKCTNTKLCGIQYLFLRSAPQTIFQFVQK